MVKKVAIIGAGHFGTVLTEVLINNGVEVMVIDKNAKCLDNVKETATIALEGDASDVRFLKVQDIISFDMVVVAFGRDFEDALLTIAALQDVGVKNITARAVTATHQRIIRHVGVNNIILPATDAAERLCQKLMMTGIKDALKLSSDYTIVEIEAGDVLFGKTLAELTLREKYNVTLVTVKRTLKRMKMGIFSQTSDVIIGVPQPDTTILDGDILIIFGKNTDITHFIKIMKKNV